MTHNRHDRPALAYRRMHHARQRREIQQEVELLRAIVAVLGDFDPQGAARNRL